MKKEMRSYRVGGLSFAVELEDPWTFMLYTEPVLERIRRCAAGLPVPTLPTRAGDHVPARTYVTDRKELPADFSPTTLDFSQYEPFLADISDSGPAFRMTVMSSGFERFSSIASDSSARLIRRITEDLPHFDIYERGGDNIFLFNTEKEDAFAILVIHDAGARAEFYTRPQMKPYTVLFHLNMALMIQYTYASSGHSALLIHSSVIEHDGKANMFLGESGTGKSTHSRLWLENIHGTVLLNDDNPVLTMENGTPCVYGSPWSGKTPCYINKKLPVRTIVSLKQAPHNKAARVRGIDAFISILTSASAIHWDDRIEEDITDTASYIADAVPCWRLECLPDADAALTCRNAIESR